jgi:hypothetical protein
MDREYISIGNSLVAFSIKSIASYKDIASIYVSDAGFHQAIAGTIGAFVMVHVDAFHVFHNKNSLGPQAPISTRRGLSKAL